MIMRILATIGLATIILCLSVVFAAIIIYVGGKIKDREDED